MEYFYGQIDKYLGSDMAIELQNNFATADVQLSEAEYAAMGDAIGTIFNVKGIIIDFLITMVLFLIIFFIAFFLLKLFKKLILLFFHRRKGHELSAKGKTVKSLVTSIYNTIMVLLLSLLALGLLGFDVSGMLKVAGFGGVAIAFGCQTLVKDFISGLFLWGEGHIKVGDIVSVAGQLGEVNRVTLRTTVLRSHNGNLISIPNGDIRTVINKSNTYKYAQVDIPIGRGKDYERALDLMNEVMKEMDKSEGCFMEKPQVLGYIAFNNANAVARVQAMCHTDKVWEIEREIRLKIMQRLTKEHLD